MVVVFKDYSRPVQHINTIPMESIDLVKDWLDSVEIPVYEGNLNLQWGTIMKTVQADPHEFFKTGGWGFLSTETGSEDEEEESEEESAFEMDESDFASEESSEAESNFDENASQEAEDEEMSDVSEGEDWDELERKAARKDRDRGEEEDEGKNRKRKR
jgi:nucleosome binding factor SPN SPT16 subunit